MPWPPFKGPWPRYRVEQMPTGEEGYETPKWRTVLLLIGFALLVGIGVVTVLQPEVEDEPSDEPVSEIETSEEQSADDSLQE